MTQEDKDLLLKDLCARLPYGVKVAIKNNGAYHHDNVAKKGDVTIDRLKGFNGRYFSIYHDDPLDWDWYDNDVDVEDVKPYLFPMSKVVEEIVTTSNKHIAVNVDFFHKNHIDYRGLIPKGLANDATGLNIY